MCKKVMNNTMHYKKKKKRKRYSHSHMTPNRVMCIKLYITKDIPLKRNI